MEECSVGRRDDLRSVGLDERERDGSIRHRLATSNRVVEVELSHVRQSRRDECIQLVGRKRRVQRRDERAVISGVRVANRAIRECVLMVPETRTFVRRHTGPSASTGRGIATGKRPARRFRTSRSTAIFRVVGSSWATKAMCVAKMTTVRAPRASTESGVPVIPARRATDIARAAACRASMMLSHVGAERRCLSQARSPMTAIAWISSSIPGRAKFVTVISALPG